MKQRYIKDFMLYGEEFASTCHVNSVTGPLIVDVGFNTLTSAQARKLAAWLLKAADEVDVHNRNRRKSAPDSAGGRDD